MEKVAQQKDELVKEKTHGVRVRLLHDAPCGQSRFNNFVVNFQPIRLTGRPGVLFIARPCPFLFLLIPYLHPLQS